MSDSDEGIPAGIEIIEIMGQKRAVLKDKPEIKAEIKGGKITKVAVKSPFDVTVPDKQKDTTDGRRDGK